MFFDRSNNFKLEGNYTAGIVVDPESFPHMDHKQAVRWKEIQENVCL